MLFHQLVSVILQACQHRREGTAGAYGNKTIRCIHQLCFLLRLEWEEIAKSEVCSFSFVYFPLVHTYILYVYSDRNI